LQMLAKTQRAANLLTSMLLFPLLMAGGSFFPFAALPGWIAAIGRRTPNGFVVDRLSTELTASAAWTIDPQSWLVIFLMAASGLAVCAWRLRAGFAQG
jgi:ABC-2 type transport system permease protein